MSRVMEAAIRGRELVRQMLTFSRKTEQEKKPLSVEHHRQGDREASSGRHAVDASDIKVEVGKRVGFDPRRPHPDPAGPHEPLHERRPRDAGERGNPRHRAGRFQSAVDRDDGMKPGPYVRLGP